MLLKIENLQAFPTTPWIEKLIAGKYKVRKVRFAHFKRASEVTHFLKLTVPQFKTYCIESKTVHGVEINNTIYVHPDGVAQIIADKLIDALKKDTLKTRRTLKSLKLKLKNQTEE